MNVVSVNQSNFSSEVLSSANPVLVDFWAPWCGPCRMLSPVLEEVAAQHPEIKICKVNVDEEPLLAQQYRVMSIPTLILFRGGEAVAKRVGLQPQSAIEAMLL